jgi:hypothetical protein
LHKNQQNHLRVKEDLKLGLRLLGVLVYISIIPTPPGVPIPYTQIQKSTCISCQVLTARTRISYWRLRPCLRMEDEHGMEAFVRQEEGLGINEDAGELDARARHWMPQLA